MDAKFLGMCTKLLSQVFHEPLLVSLGGGFLMEHSRVYVSIEVTVL